MSISELGSLGEFLSSIAVLVTLIYVALQIRQNTHATRATSHHAITDALNQLNFTIASSDSMTQIWIDGMEDRSSMSAIMLEQFDALLRAYMHICDTMYYQAQVGAGDNGLWEAEERYLNAILTSNGGKDWLKENSVSISQGFREALGVILERNQSSELVAPDALRARYGDSNFR